MLFNSFEFLLFFPIVTILFFLLPHQFRWILLLIASCIFYCYFIPVYLLILVFTILIDYVAGIKIEDAKKNNIWWLIASITANVGILAVFKYFNFFISNFNVAFGTAAPFLHVILPVGLSFHTFQAMSYTIEVYRGTVSAERHIGIYALYVLFYPQLVAGPIERPQNIIPQLHKKQIFSSANLFNGLRLITWGFFKKLVIADNLSKYVDMVYSNPHSYHWLTVMLAIFLFSIQIYCDFSGYTDIARGAARVMGYNLMINFNRPLLAKTIREFWQKWHISLSSWFRDYVYIPLGGNRKGISKKIVFLLLVFALSGFWHGAGLNFIIWGLLHASFFITGLLLFKNLKIKYENFIIKLLSILLINFLVAYSFVFFRNSSLHHAMEIISASFKFTSPHHFSLAINALNGQLGISHYSIDPILFFTAFMFWFERKTDPSLEKMNAFTWLDILWFVAMILSIIFWGVFTKETFIYFQF
jgi:D-alanyl-lipoteichoic acid acyltransferase DltB (MBOAT superfamily)